MNDISPLPLGIVTLQNLHLGEVGQTASLGCSAHPPWDGGSPRPPGTTRNPLPLAARLYSLCCLSCQQELLMN